jgi:UDP-N-acetylglucosamine:LPS N-acetylglucosamine transferase
MRRAVVLTGSLGMGHHVVTDVVVDSLGRLGFDAVTLDCMALLGRRAARAGDWLFRHLLGLPAVYDGLHFAQFRPGGPLATAMDRLATRRLVPALRTALEDQPADLVVAAFATGASAAAKLTATPSAGRRPTTVVLCTDVTPHRLWVHGPADLYLVTSQAAAAAVRRYEPAAQIVVVPPPVRRQFGHPPDQATARRALGVDEAARCTLLMGGGWGLGPLAATAEALADRGVTVLAVAGRNRRLHQALEDLARRRPEVVPFGFVDDVATLMAAADVVLTTPGATTCSEVRAVGRPLVLLDVVPGHGRDNVQHELELGDADVCDPDPGRLTASVLSVLDRVGAGEGVEPRRPRPALGPDAWEAAFGEALAVLGFGPIPTDAGAGCRPANPPRGGAVVADEPAQRSQPGHPEEVDRP